MEQKQTKWLDHLPTEVVYEARGLELDAYLVALEGWRRGLMLKWHAKDHENFKDMLTWFTDRPGKLFSLHSATKKHYFFRTRGDLVTNNAVKIASNKAKTKEVLSKHDVNVAKGMYFDELKEPNDIINYVKKIGFPVVIKPIDGSFGRGVFLKLQTLEEVEEAITQLRSENKTARLIVEQFYQGDDYRIYVVGDEVVAAIKRIPANIVGDGKQTIAQLIEQKNEIRKTNPRLVSCLIDMNNELKGYLKQHGRTLKTIPEKEEVVFLSDKCNISIGGDSIDVLDQLSQQTKTLAVHAIKAVSGLAHGAVDLIHNEEQGSVVIELNPTAQIGSLVFPMYGQARDVPAKLIDYYFPETKALLKKRSALYFDLYDVLEPLSAKVLTTTLVSKALLGEVYGKKFIVSGEVQDVGYHRGLRKQAFENKLSGYIKSLTDGKIEVVVVGNDKQSIERFKSSILEDPERSMVESLEEEDFDQAIKIGFEIKADFKMQLERLKDIETEMKVLKEEVAKVEETIATFHKSKSWKLTTPFRYIGAIYKKIAKNYN